MPVITWKSMYRISTVVPACYLLEDLSTGNEWRHCAALVHPTPKNITLLLLSLLSTRFGTSIHEQRVETEKRTYQIRKIFNGEKNIHWVGTSNFKVGKKLRRIRIRFRIKSDPRIRIRAKMRLIRNKGVYIMRICRPCPAGQAAYWVSRTRPAHPRSTLTDPRLPPPFLPLPHPNA